MNLQYKKCSHINKYYIAIFIGLILGFHSNNIVFANELVCDQRSYLMHIYYGIGFATPVLEEGSYICVPAIDFNFTYGGPRFPTTGKGLISNPLRLNDIIYQSNDKEIAQYYPPYSIPPLRGSGDSISVDIVSADKFTLVFSGRFYFNGGKYTFIYGADDGIHVWIDNFQFINEWKDGGFKRKTKELTLNPGWYNITISYYENRWNARVLFYWQPPQ